jgi:hypothetical protein
MTTEKAATFTAVVMYIGDLDDVHVAVGHD